MWTESLHRSVPSSSVTGCLLRLCQLLLQFDELILEFDHGMCDDAGRQGGARSRGSRARGCRIVNVLESPKHASRNCCLGGRLSIPKSLKALNNGSSLVIVMLSLSCGAMEARWPYGEDDGKTYPRVAGRSRLSAVLPCVAESQRTRAASLLVRLSRSFTLIMSRVSTLDALPGAAAAITIRCA
jgi:hypothetical protein